MCPDPGCDGDRGHRAACRNVGELHGSYAEARAAIEYKAVTGGGKPIYIQDMERLDRSPVEQDNHREQQLLSTIKFGSKEQIAALVDQLLYAGEEGWSSQARLIGIWERFCPSSSGTAWGEGDAGRPRGVAPHS